MKLVKYLIASSIANLFLVGLFIGVIKNFPKQDINLSQDYVLGESELKTNGQLDDNSLEPLNTENTKTPPVQTKTSNPVTSPSSVPTAPPTIQKKPQCLIKIDGNIYNLESFRSQHGGGDIFQCGSDMTQIFYNQHSQDYLQIISMYRIQ